MNRLLAFVATVALLAPAVQAGDPPTHRGSNSKSNTRKPVANSQTAPPDNANERRPTKRSTDPVMTASATQSRTPADKPSTKSGKQSAPRIANREAVVAASHDVPVEETVMMDDGHSHHGSDCGCDSCGHGGFGSSCDGSCGGSCDGGCGSCGWSLNEPCDLGCCNSCFQPSRLCLCLPQDCWAQMDYLMWWQDPMRIPPLAIQADTPAQALLPGAQVLLGAGNNTGRDTMLNDRRSGGRIRFGWNLSRFKGLGIQGEYFGLGNAADNFLVQGTPGAAPFFAIPYIGFVAPGPRGGENAFIAHNRIAFEARSQLDGGGVSFRRSLYCGNSCEPSWFNCAPVPTQHRFDAMLGYRYIQLQESLQGNYAGDIPNTTTSFTVQDRFRTFNQFNGVDFGFNWQAKRGYWSLDALMRMALGNVRETVRIDGTSTISNNRVVLGGPINSGFLASSSNIGSYQQDSFAVVPELGANIGYQLTKRVRLNAGYTFIYWSKVVRPGDQIDRDINADNVPVLNNGRPNLGTNPNRPQFNFVETDYWVQGLNLGAEYRW